MVIGDIITRALNRSNLPVSDYDMREIAWEMLLEIIDEHWESKHWGFRKKALTLTTADGTEAYSLDKRVKINDIVPNSMRGSDPVRRLRYEPSHDFYRKRPYELEESSPYYFRDGELQGYSTNPSSASAIAFVSSLTNYSTGTVMVVKGQNRVVMTTGVVSVDRVGQYIRVGSDTKVYKIVRLEHGSTSIFYLNEAYDGANNATATFLIGDLGQKVTVMGYVSGQLQEEEVQINGSVSVSTVKLFTSLVKISKSEKTHGYITGTSNAAAVTNIVLDPGETETDIQTVKLYPIPAEEETINFEAYIRHPRVYKYSDSPLFPQEYHNLLVIDLYIRLETEWNKNEVAQAVYSRRDKILTDMTVADNNTDQWTFQVEDYEESDRASLSNLPAGYEDDGFF